MTDNGTVSILVPQAVAKQILKRLMKLTRMAGVDVLPVPGETTLIKDDRAIVCSRFTISEMPRLAGYRFAARLQHEAGGNVVARAPGERAALESVFGIDNFFDFRTAPNKCSHCNVSRRRKETFLMRDQQGQLVQIGRQCLADFLQTDPAQMVRYAEIAAEIDHVTSDGEWGGYWGSYGSESTLRFVCYATASFEMRGFVKSVSGCDDERERWSTRTHTEWLMRPLMGEPPQRVIDEWNLGQPNAEQQAKAALALEWAQSQGEGASEFLWNLRVAAGSRDVGKNAGILAALPMSYARAMGEVIERKKKVQPAPPRAGYAAEAGWLWKGEATLVRRAMTEGQWRSTAICTFRSTDGFEIVWFASSRSPQEIGARYKLKGRVKRTEVRNGVHQTVISRASYSEIAEEESAAAGVG